MSRYWKGRNVLVTGGASFIGSHLVEALIERGATVRIVDDLSSGKIENIQPLLDRGLAEFRREDLLDPAVARTATTGMDTVFHLAARHGGRGYIDEHDTECSRNLALDSHLFYSCFQSSVEKVIYASSGCVYPLSRQTDPDEEVYLREEMAGPPYEADNLYGWAKLMAEKTLKAYYDRHGMKSASCRYFTAYGPRCGESHAVMAFIARGFRREDPFEVWGDGRQIRNWTYITDIVDGTIAAGEHIDDASAVNLGTVERVSVIDAVRMTLAEMGHQAELRFRMDKPTGPLNRVADHSRATALLGWTPKVRFQEGLERTIRWYCQ